MRFGNLGVLRCEPDVGIDLSRRREGRILGALLLSANRTVSTEQLIDLLWPERPPSTARQQVQNCMTGLVRRYAGAAAPMPVERVAPGYRLVLGAADLDALAFEEDFGRAADATAAGDDAAAAALLRAALGRWRGEVLLGLDMGPFTPAVIRLEELRLGATEQLFAIELRRGRHREVVADLAAAVRRHPERESLVRYAMTALQAGGRTTEALALFAHVRRVLRDELGIEPSPNLVALNSSILRAQAPAVAETPHQNLADMVASAEAVRRRLDLAIRATRHHIHGILPAPGLEA